MARGGDSGLEQLLCNTYIVKSSLALKADDRCISGKRAGQTSVETSRVRPLGQTGPIGLTGFLSQLDS